jgi:hypothetical protein
VRHAAALAFGMVCAMVCTPGGATAVAQPARGAELRDPTRPPLPVVPGKHSEEHKPQVSAILLSSTRRVAIFDTLPVRAGDTVGVYHIDEVDAQGVRYSSSGHSAFAPLATVR